MLWQPALVSPYSWYPILNLLWPRAHGHAGATSWPRNKAGWLRGRCLTGWPRLGGFIAIQDLGLIFFLYTEAKKGIYYNMNITGGSDSPRGLENQPQRLHSSGQHKSIQNHVTSPDQARHHCFLHHWAEPCSLCSIVTGTGPHSTAVSGTPWCCHCHHQSTSLISAGWGTHILSLLQN